MAKLGDICNIQSGGTPSRSNPSYWVDGHIPWVKISDIKGKYLDHTEESITEDGLENSSAKVFPAGTLLYTIFATLGETCILNIDASTNQAIAGIQIKSGSILRDYLYYFLLSQKANVSAMGRGVAQNNINLKMLREFELPIPPLETQRHIAALLDKVTDLIAKRRAQLDKLDLLVKARFVEMFGDPLRNTKGWPCLELTKVCKAIFGGGTPSKSHPEYFMGTVPWVSPKDMKQAIISDSIDHITEEAIANSTTNLVPVNSVLMVIRSGILKHTLPVAINSVPVAINQDMKAFVPDSNILTEFLMHYFKAIETDVLAGVRGVTADNIDFKAFQKRKIIVPPHEVQKEYAVFVQYVDKAKLTIQQSLEKLETLKKALMQQYFG